MMPDSNFLQARRGVLLPTGLGLAAIMLDRMAYVSSVQLTEEVGVALRKGWGLELFQFGEM